MKCYNHHDRDAFGICQSCGKGLCLECLKEQNGIILCKNNSRCFWRLNKCRFAALIAFICIVIMLVLLLID